MRGLFITLAAWSALSAAAYGQKVTIEFDHAVNFAKYRTFVVRNETIKGGDPAFDNELVEKNLRTDIVRRMTARGLVEVDRPGDLILNFRLATGKGREVITYPAGWRGRRVGRRSVPVSRGTLVIDLRDGASRELVWRAVVAEEEPNSARLQERLSKMVEKACEKYPPKE